MKIVSKTILYETYEEFTEHYKEMIQQGYDYICRTDTPHGIEVAWRMINETKWNSYSISAST